MFNDIVLNPSKSVICTTEYRWIVVCKDGDVQMGICASFKDALQALSDWHGDGTLHDILGFTIHPIRRYR